MEAKQQEFINALEQVIQMRIDEYDGCMIYTKEKNEMRERLLKALARLHES